MLPPENLRHRWFLRVPTPVPVYFAKRPFRFSESTRAPYLSAASLPPRNPSLASRTLDPLSFLSSPLPHRRRRQPPPPPPLPLPVLSSLRSLHTANAGGLEQGSRVVSLRSGGRRGTRDPEVRISGEPFIGPHGGHGRRRRRRHWLLPALSSPHRLHLWGKGERVDSSPMTAPAYQLASSTSASRDTAGGGLCPGEGPEYGGAGHPSPLTNGRHVTLRLFFSPFSLSLLSDPLVTFFTFLFWIRRDLARVQL